MPVVNAMIDTGFKASEVHRFCQASSWKAIKGDDAEWFLSQHPRTGKTVRRAWRRVLTDGYRPGLACGLRSVGHPPEDRPGRLRADER